MAAAGGYSSTQDAEQSVLLRAAAVRMAQPTPEAQPWTTSFEGWEDIATPPPQERLCVAGGNAIVWQVKIGHKFGCGLWVDVTPCVSNAVEASFQLQKNIVTADEGYGRWAMDPMLMEQTNMEAKMVRPMRRVIVTNDMREVE